MAKTSGTSLITFYGDAKSAQHMLMMTEMALTIGMHSFFEGEVSQWLQERAERRFASEGDDISGGPWEPLADSTQRIRAAGRLSGQWSVGDDHPINQRTGELKDYITSGEGDTFQTGSDTEFIYPSVALVNDPELFDKMQTAQQGGGARRSQRFTNPAPPREVIGVSEIDLGFMLTALSIHVGSWSGLSIP